MAEGERLAELLTAFSRKGHTPNERPWRELVDNSATLLRAQSARIAVLEEALWEIADIGEGSTTANSLPHVARIATKALGKGSE